MRFRPRRLSVALTLAAILCLTGLVSAQRFSQYFGSHYDPPINNAKYDGQFTFVRLKFTVGDGGYYYPRGNPLPAWAHGFELGEYRADSHLMKIMDSITALHPNLEKTNVLGMDDPELFKFPVAFMTEAGFWLLTDKEIKEFGAYLKKGGFVIFDDFRDSRGGGGWAQFETNMKRIIPGAELVAMTPQDPIFHCFFDIDSFDIIPQSYSEATKPQIWGIYEDNDPKKRLLAIANYNVDISDYWQFSADGIKPVDESNEAFKLGVNYIMYGLTH